MSQLLFFLPDSALPVVFELLALGVIIGIVRPRRAGSIILMLLGAVVAAPFIESLFAALPWWVSCAMLLAAVVGVSRVVLEAAFGHEAAGHIIGGLVLRLLGLAARIALLPFRLAGHAVHLLTTRGA